MNFGHSIDFTDKKSYNQGVILMAIGGNYDQ